MSMASGGTSTGVMRARMHLRGAGDLLRPSRRARAAPSGRRPSAPAWRRPPSSGRARCGSRPRRAWRRRRPSGSGACNSRGQASGNGRRRLSRLRPRLRRRGLHAGELEEIGEQRVAVLGGDALGMELHAVHGMRLVLQAHDQAVAGLGRDRQAVGQRLRARRSANDSASTSKRLRQALEHALARVGDLRQLAVHRHRRADHLAAVGLADRLVAEADAEQRDRRPAPSRSARGRCRPRWACRAPATARWPCGFSQHLGGRDLVVAEDLALARRARPGSGRGCR